MGRKIRTGALLILVLVMSWKSPRLMERMDIIYQSRPL